MVDGGVLVFTALQKRLPLGLADKFFRLAKGQAGIFCEAFSAFADEHYVRTRFQDFPRETNWIF